MDGNAILSAARHHQDLITWIRDGENEWRYCGVGPELNLKLVSTVIADHFPTSEIYYVGERPDCSPVSRNSACDYVRDHLKTGSGSLWSPQFDRVIEFSAVGVFRLGSRPA